MKKIILFMLLITFIFPKKSISQNDDAWGAAMLAGVGLVVAIEKNKEVLESLAANYVMENFSQYTEFNLQVIGIGGGGKKMSGEGTVSLVPFAFTELSGGQKTENRNIILLFASRGWMNKFGVDYTKLRWEFWDQNKWNNLISKYGQLNSPIKSKISDNLFPEYLKFSSTRQAKPKDSGFISIKQGGENLILSNSDGEIIQNIQAIEVPTDKSYSCIPDGDTQNMHLSVPTPSESNQELFIV